MKINYRAGVLPALLERGFFMENKLSDFLVQHIRQWFRENGRDTAVIGISGGKDSTVVAALCARALGPQNVVGVLMPDGVQPDIQDSFEVVDCLDIPHTVINLDPITSGFRAAFSHQVAKGLPGEYENIPIFPPAAINVPARVRMTVLYCVAQSLPGRHAAVVGTGNAAEAYVGYCTKWGDAASDFAPIRELWVHQVVAVGRELGLPEHLLVKPPADGLSGKTDEDRLGFTYEMVYHVATGQHVPEDKLKRIREMHERSAHKRGPIPTISLSGFKK